MTDIYMSGGNRVAILDALYIDELTGYLSIRRGHEVRPIGGNPDIDAPDNDSAYVTTVDARLSDHRYPTIGFAPLTDGDPIDPQLIFLDGDCIMVPFAT